MERKSTVSVSGKLTVLHAFALIAAAAGMAWAQPANGILMERWDGITGDTVPNLTGNASYPDNPSVRSYPALYEIPANTADNYGTRTRGYVTAPTTGNYTFWIAGDDHCELWLGTSGDPATARRIAYVPDYTNSREWGKFTQQQSAQIALTAGTRYYIETRHKEGTGNDNMAVGWQGPGITGDAERPIPGSRLAPFVLTAPAAKTILLERWDGITGTGVASLTSSPNYPNSPTSRIYPTLYEMATATGDNYGTRTRGYVTPPTTGNYTFWIASDDNSELWLGTNDNPATIRQIASVPEWTNSREWGKFTQQQSAQIALTAGTRYYIETRHKEGTGGDNLAVGWQGPGIAGDAERPIPGSRLAPPSAGSPPAITAQPANQTVAESQAATFSVTATGAAPLSYQWRKNGVNISGATGSSYSTPPTVPADDGAQFSVTVTNSSGSVTSANASLTVLHGAVIVTQPSSQTVNLGQAATFSVTATGTGPLTYQWRRNSVNIPGATGPTYTTPPATAADNGAIYFVVVENAYSGAISSNAVLTVVIPPAIVTQPSNRTVSIGQTAAFSVVASGTDPLYYIWRRNGLIIAGASSATYVTPPVTASDNGAQFSVEISNAAGSLVSANAVLTVVATPAIITHPANITVAVGQTASFSVTASGTAPLSYRWERNSMPITGATSASYTTPPTTGSDAGSLFRVVVSNAYGSVTSNPAHLQVYAPPAIVTQPANTTVNTGQAATFTVVATGSATLIYQWRRNGTPIGGATTASYTTPLAVPADNGAQFSVSITNSVGNVISANAVLTVVTVAPNSRKLAVSGELVDAAGNPLGYPTPVTVDAVITLYDAATAGTLRYTEEFRAAAGRGIRVENGLFVARLGEGASPQDLRYVLTTYPSLWAEVTIDDGSPDVLSPRTPITSAAFALGGVPASAAPSSLSGAGDPNALLVEAAVGASYINTLDNSTWFKLSTAWKRMD